MRATSKIPSVRVCALIHSSLTEKKKKKKRSDSLSVLIFTRRKIDSRDPILTFDRYYFKFYYLSLSLSSFKLLYYIIFSSFTFSLFPQILDRIKLERLNDPAESR